MSKRQAPVRLSDYKASKLEEGSVVIETDDGQLFRIPPPETWDDDVLDLMNGEHVREALIRLIGAETYEAFVAAGGSAMLALGVLKDATGVSVGK